MFRDDLDKDSGRALFEKGHENENILDISKPRRQEFSDSGGDNYGPKLPSKPCFGPQKPESKSTLFWIIMAVSFIGVPILILLVALKFKISSVVYHRFYDRRARCRR